MPEAKPRTVTFRGIPSRDGDFHFVVDRATFEDMTGRGPSADEVVGRGKYRLYPEHIAALLRGHRMVRVKISVEPL